MVTQRDHINNALNQLLAKKHQLESEVREIEEVIAAMKKAPELLGDFKPPVAHSRAEAVKSIVKGTPINRDLSEKVLAYLSTFPYGEKIHVVKMIEELRDRGVSGKERSLYAYINSLLKKWHQAKQHDIDYTPGVGYTRKRAEIYKPVDAELVHSA